ncbi:MAG: LamG domain-containing protein [Deltaproteobacteria bacterium]|nr:LamG domain-containing protein [Deltaproteobacteria bacterium]
MRVVAVVAGAVIAAGGCSIVVDTSGLSGGSTPAPSVDAGEDRAEPRDAAPVDAGSDARGDADAGDPTLVGDWPFDEGSGGAILDRSGRGHDGVAIGASWVDDHANRPASALRLTGNGGLVGVTAHADFDRPANAALTLVAWMRMDDVPNHDLFFSVSYGDQDSSFGIEVITPTELTYWDGTQHAATATIPAIGTGWHHYGVVVEGGSVKIFFDGVRVSQGPIETTPRKSTQVLFGPSTFGNRLDGAIDGLRYYRRALGDAEILAEKNR